MVVFTGTPDADLFGRASLLVQLMSASAAYLQPHNIRPALSADNSLRITWDLRCAAERCNRQQAFRVTLMAENTNAMVLNTGRRESTDASHIAYVALKSATAYRLDVSVWSGTPNAHSASVRMYSAIPDGDWQGQWLGGFTQMRGSFTLEQPRRAVVSALAHASGVGCFAMSLNGRAADAAEANTSYMNPGWANIPTVRMLYRQFDVHSLLLDGPNVVGARLGQCKYGYQGSFCTGAHGSLAACRAFTLHLSIRYDDGSEQLVLTRPTSSNDAPTRWLGTSVLNPIRYTHLYHGEVCSEGQPANHSLASESPTPLKCPNPNVSETPVFEPLV